LEAPQNLAANNPSGSSSLELRFAPRRERNRMGNPLRTTNAKAS